MESSRGIAPAVGAAGPGEADSAAAGGIDRVPGLHPGGGNFMTTGENAGGFSQ